MNTIQDRIRTAARAAADTVPPDDVPPLRLPAAGPARRIYLDPRRSGRGLPSRLAPAAAAAAVIAVAVVSAMAGIGPSGRTAAPVPKVSAARPGPAGTTPGPPVSSYVNFGRVPPYYLLIKPSGGHSAGRSSAFVEATVSGKTLAAINPATASQTIVAVTAAADDRTFVLGEQSWAPAKGAEWTKAINFYLLRLNPAGQAGPQTRLPMSVPAGQMMTGLALSPSGGKLAISIRPRAAKDEPSTQEIKVFPLDTGQVRTWSGYGTIGDSYATRSLSWADGERTLAFDWQSGPARGVRLLNLATGGGSLLAGSRPATSLGGSAGRGGTLTFCLGESILTPDGSAVVCAAQAIVRTGASGTPLPGTRSGFAEFSTATGRITRILGDWTLSPSGPLAADVLWSDPTGHVLIVMVIGAALPGQSGSHYIGVISGHDFTPLNVQWTPAAPDPGTW